MRRAAGVVLVCCVIAAACSGAPPPPLLQELDALPVAEGAAQPRWPDPPQPARIEYLGEVSTERAFDRRFSLWKRIKELVTGDEGLRFVRPAALCAHGSVLTIADPGLAVVHRLDLSARRWVAMHRRGEQALRSPVGVACLPDGRTIVADSALEALWVFDPDGHAMGSFGPEQLERPTGLAFDAIRSWVWVVETRANRIRAFDLSGREERAFGRRGSGPGELHAPTAIALDGRGGVWVTDSLNFRLQHFDADGNLIGGFGAAGDTPGSFARPRGVTSDSRGRLFVVDALFDAIQIFDPAGQLLLIFGGHGVAPGQLWLPAGVAFAGDRHLFVSDSYNRRVQVFAYRPPEGDAP